MGEEGARPTRRRRRRRASRAAGPEASSAEDAAAHPAVGPPSGAPVADEANAPAASEPLPAARGADQASAPAASGPVPVAPMAREPAAKPPRRRAPRDAAAERGLRDIVGAGRSQLGVSGALRARDVNRPTDEDLADAERDVVIVRRNWKPDSGR